MTQPVFDFTAPVQTQGSVRSRHASAEGARHAEERIGRQMLEVMTAYRQYGPLTDVEVEAKTGIQKSSIIPRRRELQKRGLVVELGHRKNPTTGISNTVFGLPGQTL